MKLFALLSLRWLERKTRASQAAAAAVAGASADANATIHDYVDEEGRWSAAAEAANGISDAPNVVSVNVEKAANWALRFTLIWLFRCDCQVLYR